MKYFLSNCKYTLHLQQNISNENGPSNKLSRGGGNLICKEYKLARDGNFNIKFLYIYYLL